MSDFLRKNAFGILRKNEKVLSLIKDEFCKRSIAEFAGTRSKAYGAEIYAIFEEIKKVEGVQKNVEEKTIIFDDYVQGSKDSLEIKREQNVLRVQLHNVYTTKEEKVALDSSHNKQYLIFNCFFYYYFVNSMFME